MAAAKSMMMQAERGEVEVSHVRKTKPVNRDLDALDEMFMGKVCDNIDFVARDEAVYELTDDFCESYDSVVWGIFFYIIANVGFCFFIGLLAWIYSMWQLRRPVFKAIAYTILLAIVMRVCGGLLDPRMECSLVKNSAGKNRWYCDGPLGR